MIGVLRYQHVRKQTRTGHAAGDWPRRGFDLDDLLATRTGELRSHVPNHAEARRHVVEHLGDILPNATLLDLAQLLGDLPDSLTSRRDLAFVSADDLGAARTHLRLGIGKLLERTLRGMFDGPTTVSVDWDAGPGIVLDLSAVFGNTEALPLVQMAATAWLQTVMADLHRQGRRGILVDDEVWAMLATERAAKHLQARLKLCRLYGIWNLLICHRLSDLRAQSDDGTAAAKVAAGLLADVQTRVVFRQAPDQVTDARELLHLTEVETTLITRLVKGRALWRVANRATVVQHVIGHHERRLVDTDAAMTARATTMTDRGDILRRTDLAALLVELSPSPPTRLGQTARCRCIDPGHDDQHPSISMFTDRRGIQRWRCWSGGHGGTAIDALLVGRGGTVAEVMAQLERRAGVPSDQQRDRVVRSVPQPPPAEEVPVSAALLEYVGACERLLWRPVGRSVLDYLVQERGLAPDVLEANHVGADPGPHALRRAAGLPRGGPAAVLPTIDPRGSVTYVQARYLAPAEDRPKYDNPAGRLAANPRIGWCTPPRQRDREYLLVCEGAIDALTAAGAGVSAVAVLGATYVDERVAARIAEGAAGRSVVIAFDGDHAGQAATESLSAALATAGCTSRSLSLQAGTDLNSVVRQEGDWIGRQLYLHSGTRSLHRDLARNGR